MDTIIEFRARRIPKSGVIIEMRSGTSVMAGGQNRPGGGGGSGMPDGRVVGSGSNSAGIQDSWRSKTLKKSYAKVRSRLAMPVKKEMKVKCGVKTIVMLTAPGAQGLAA